jgi:hypothetical protein
MAKIIEEKWIVTLSRIASNLQEGLDPVLDDDKIETLQQAVEGLVDDASIIVEVEKQ